jgi:hypothetical protein
VSFATDGTGVSAYVATTAKGYRRIVVVGTTMEQLASLYFLDNVKASKQTNEPTASNNEDTA